MTEKKLSEILEDIAAEENEATRTKYRLTEHVDQVLNEDGNLLNRLA